MADTVDNQLPADIYSVAQVRAIDRFYIDSCGIPGIRLMKKAGAAAFRQLITHWPETRRLVVICGAGNNAGDGFVIAQHAMLAGVEVQVVGLFPVEKLRGDARSVAEEWLALGGQVKALEDVDLTQEDVLVDALLGTGLDRRVEGHFAEAIDAINQAGRPVLAVDIPSGINGDTGKVMGCAVRAAVTATFIAMKQGLLTGDAPEFCGDIRFVALTATGHDQVPVARLMRNDDVVLPRRKRTAHKGDFGHAVLVGGDLGYSGAIRLASESAARMGAGLVSVVTHPQHAGVLNIGQPEIMCRGAETVAEAKTLLDKARAIGLGPGLGQGRWGSQLFQHIRNLNLPMVIDADALNLLAQKPALQKNWVLTPHPGEAARLLGCSVAEVECDRFSAIRKVQAFYGGVIVLKGAGSLVFDGQRLVICNRGNPGMASGGMGDVLTGVITACLAQGLDLMTAACVGVGIHAHAADRAVVIRGERGLLAGDLIEFLGLDE